MSKTVNQQSEVPSFLLRNYLPKDQTAMMPVSYQSGMLARRFTVAEIHSLAIYGHVYGVLKKNSIASIRLCTSIRVACQSLSRGRVGSEMSPTAITKKRSTGMKWATRFDQAKLGRVSGFARLTHTPQECVTECLPGGSGLLVERRVCV